MHPQHTDDGMPGLAMDCSKMASLSHGSLGYHHISICTVVPDKQTELSTTESLVMFPKTGPNLLAIASKAE